MISQKKLDYLMHTYSVFYDKDLQAYRRKNQETPYKLYELGVITEFITGDNILTKGEMYDDNFTEYAPDGGESTQTCICGCSKCVDLFKMTHKETGDSFLVGSDCIGKANGHENFPKDVLCAIRNGKCLWCQNVIIFKGPRKTAKKKHLPFCTNCFFSTKKVYLNITFQTSKEFKKKYDIAYDPNCKLWYWKGRMSVMPPEIRDFIKPLYEPPKIAFVQDDED
jgi:hypothetical protein